MDMLTLLGKSSDIFEKFTSSGGSQIPPKLSILNSINKMEGEARILSSIGLHFVYAMKTYTWQIIYVTDQYPLRGPDP